MNGVGFRPCLDGSFFPKYWFLPTCYITPLYYMPINSNSIHTHIHIYMHIFNLANYHFNFILNVALPSSWFKLYVELMGSRVWSPRPFSLYSIHGRWANQPMWNSSPINNFFLSSKHNILLSCYNPLNNLIWIMFSLFKFVIILSRKCSVDKYKIQ